MKRMKFNSRGQLVSVDSGLSDYLSDSCDFEKDGIHLKKSSELEFLKERNNFESVVDNSSWNLNSDSGKLLPLKFSNGKTQEDVVNEVVELIKGGTKVRVPSTPIATTR